MKINDEVHHLANNNTSEKSYTKMLKIKSKKQISLTATLKILENVNKSDCDINVSNDNEELFGKVIVRKGLLWAITNNIVCDYIVQTVITDEYEFHKMLEEYHIHDELDKKLFLSAYTTLKSIKNNDSTKLLIFANSCVNALKIINHLNVLNENYFINVIHIFHHLIHKINLFFKRNFYN
jgi:predicted helicase